MIFGLELPKQFKEITNTGAVDILTLNNTIEFRPAKYLSW